MAISGRTTGVLICFFIVVKLDRDTVDMMSYEIEVLSGEESARWEEARMINTSETCHK